MEQSPYLLHVPEGTGQGRLGQVRPGWAHRMEWIGAEPVAWEGKFVRWRNKKVEFNQEIVGLD